MHKPVSLHLHVCPYKIIFPLPLSCICSSALSFGSFLWSSFHTDDSSKSNSWGETKGSLALMECKIYIFFRVEGENGGGQRRRICFWMSLIEAPDKVLTCRPQMTSLFQSHNPIRNLYEPDTFTWIYSKTLKPGNTWKSEVWEKSDMKRHHSRWLLVTWITSWSITHGRTG